MSEHMLTDADNTKLVEATMGDIITIRLAENPTTGYRWAVDKFDEGLISLQDSGYSIAPNAGIGGGGVRKITLRAQQAGTAHIELQLRRAAQGDASVAQRYSVTIAIRPG